MNTVSKRNPAAHVPYSSQRGYPGLENLDLRSTVGLVVERPFANIASIIPVGRMEAGVGPRKPVDILPEIDIPVDF
ncbi:MAG TPA: hypothetical protein VKS24_01715 [Bradyrhizobium sp.]|nr:hypothetical protein [Bradyrhizobium sp.]